MFVCVAAAHNANAKRSIISMRSRNKNSIVGKDIRQKAKRHQQDTRNQIKDEEAEPAAAQWQQQQQRLWQQQRLRCGKEAEPAAVAAVERLLLAQRSRLPTLSHWQPLSLSLSFRLSPSLCLSHSVSLSVCVSVFSMWLPHKFIACLCMRRLIMCAGVRGSFTLSVCICVSCVCVCVGRSCLRRSFVNEHAVNRARPSRQAGNALARMPKT